MSLKVINFTGDISFEEQVRLSGKLLSNTRESILIVAHREMPSLSVMIVMLHIEVGGDCSSINILGMKERGMCVTCVDIKLRGRQVSQDIYRKYMKE